MWYYNLQNVVVVHNLCITLQGILACYVRYFQLIKLVEPEEARAAATPTAAELALAAAEDDEWKVMGPRNRGAVERRWAARRTPVADIFRGRTRLRLHKAAHHDVTDAVQPFFTLQLDIEVSRHLHFFFRIKNYHELRGTA